MSEVDHKKYPNINQKYRFEKNISWISEDSKTHRGNLATLIIEILMIFLAAWIIVNNEN